MPTANLSETVAAEIRVQLARHRKRGADLADELGISAAAVSSKLNDKTPFTLNEVQQIATWLGLSLDQLLGEAGA
jgi:transcriptional regulator with XRE-family HTH domain